MDNTESTPKPRSRFFPRGIRNPDSMVTNRHLYAGTGLSAGRLFGVDKNIAIKGTGKKAKLF